VNQPRATLAAGMEVTPSVRLVRPIGEGGMGAVWLADHSGLSTQVVVKFMLGGLDSSASARTRFKREAEAASQVKSPHVVQTFDYGVTAEGVPFIVMEHLEGRDLRDELAARGALDPATVVAIVTQVAKALSKAHGAGLLHRDIKPDNIFLCHGEADDELFVKLLDFGIAKAHTTEGEVELDGQSKTGQVVGTPFYMSPEQVTAQKVVDLRSDLWSLGVVAFEALTGQRPYDGPSFGALAVKIATGPCPKPSDVNPALPAGVDAWFARACAREPGDRFASARELADRLRGAFEGIVSLPPTESGSRAASSGSRPTKPSAVAVDEGASSRPSFVLASTVQTDDPAGDRSALARSEPGHTTVPATQRSGEGPGIGSRSRGKVYAGLFLVGAVSLALAAGWKAKEHSEERSSASAPPSFAPAATSPGPVTAKTSPLATTTDAAAAHAPPVTSASASALASASPPPSASASAHAVASASAAPHPVAIVPAGVRSAPTPSAKPTGTVAPPSSARPTPSGHDDPLF
jgi:serine/threonine-protein kinase